MFSSVALSLLAMLFLQCFEASESRVVKTSSSHVGFQSLSVRKSF
jgi:hypothetical protein